MTSNLLHQIALSSIKGIGPRLAKRLIAYCGSIEAVFEEKKRGLQKIPGFGDKIIHNMDLDSALKMAEKEIDYIRKNHIQALFYLDEDYPDRLKNCEDSPLVLFVDGEVNFKNDKIISMVGTRKASDYGRTQCEKLISELKERGHEPLIVSGLAYGIDVCAHRAALKQNLSTVGVLGHGLSFLYPSAHRKTAEEIKQNGALVSDFLHDIDAEPPNFVKRNRIIAGMADATIIVESAVTGGALITADLANSYNRDVFAFPGRISDKYSAGCNKLIKSNKAALIESAKDLEYILGWDQINSKPRQTQMFVDLNNEELKTVEILASKGALAIDELSFLCEFPLSKLSSILLNLEFAGKVKCLPGKVYKLV